MALSCNVEVVDYKVNAFDCSPFSDIVDLYIINHTTYVKSGVFLYLLLPYLVLYGLINYVILLDDATKTIPKSADNGIIFIFVCG